MTTYAKLESGFWNDPKVFDLIDSGAEDAGFLYCRLLSYCSQNLNDGLVGASELRHALGATPRQIQALVDVRLLDELDGEGSRYRVHAYTGHQRTREDVEQQQERTAERVRRFRAKKRGTATVTALHSACKCSPRRRG